MASANGRTGDHPRRRVVITGMGAVSPLGQDVASFWEALTCGRSGIGWMTLCDTTAYPVKVAGEVKDWVPERFLERKDARRMARFSQFAVVAAGQAVADAGLDLDREDRTRVGVYLGNGNGGYPNIEEAVRTIVARGGMRMDPLFMPKSLPNMAASQVSLQLGLKGYTGTVSTACASGTQALGEAAEVIRRGAADVMLSGGAEAGISELGLGAFAVMKAMSTRTDDPTRASRPFDAGRDGFVPAEGAAVLVLESLEHAEARGAPVLCEITGFAVSADAYHIVAPCADGEGSARTMRWAIADAGRTVEEVDYINAHGTSTQLNDQTETVAIKAVFGEHAYRVPISSTKSMIGHALGAAGALEVVACVKTLQSGIIHPTVNYETPDPDCDLDYVPNVARPAGVQVILKNSFGFGGQNACLVLEQTGTLMHVLVLGGAGYIGSVTVEGLLDAGHRVTVFDDLSYGHRAAVDPRAELVVGSTLDPAALDRAFADPVDAVMHFAAFIAVGESMQIPEAYFRNNVAATINVLEAMVAHDVRRIVFSSTAALFGDPEYVPIDEQHPLRPINPYGESKLIVEQMLRWFDERRGIKYVALRYFNASGASERFGEDHDPETHLIPIVLEVAQGKRDALPLFGDDYPTRDGTCVRDYVHVVDLAAAHILALAYAAERSGRFNLGSGLGSTNLEVVEAARRVTGHPIPIGVQPRRPGDPPALVAASALARSELAWQPHYDDLDAIVASAWRWRTAHPDGYGTAGE